MEEACTGDDEQVAVPREVGNNVLGDPSAKRSCLASPPIFLNGSTVIEGLSGSGNGALCTAATGCTGIGGGAPRGQTADAKATIAQAAANAFLERDSVNQRSISNG